MKIDEKSQTPLKQLIHSQRRLVSAKEQEIENVRNFYDKKIEADRFSGQKDLIEMQDINQQEILAATEQKSDRLEKMRESLQKDLSRLENEKKILQTTDQLEKTAAAEQMRDEQVSIISENYDKTKELSQKASEELVNMQKESEWQLAKVSAENRRNIDKASRDHESTLADKMRTQRVQLAASEIEHHQKLIKLRSDFERDAGQVTRSNMVDKLQKEQHYLKTLKSTEAQHQYLLQQKQKQFEEKFANLESQHNQVIGLAEDRFKQQLDALTKSYMEVREAKAAKKEDPFYQLRTLAHSVESTPEAYFVRIEVPEHEVPQVLLSGHNRSLKLTMTRRFSERHEAEDGRVNVNKRSESFTQEFPVADIINSKDVTRKYEDGILSFRIGKA